MMFCCRTLLLLMFSFAVHAESATPPQPKSGLEVQVYTKESATNVEALNKATEVLRDPVKAFSASEADKKELIRDPTQMSGNFRQALKNIPIAGANNTNPNAANNTPNLTIPAIELAAKIMGKNKSVMLRINGRVIQVTEGGRVTLVENQQVITIQVEKIDINQVRISVLPYNEHLILQ